MTPFLDLQGELWLAGSINLGLVVGNLIFIHPFFNDSNKQNHKHWICCYYYILFYNVLQYTEAQIVSAAKHKLHLITIYTQCKANTAIFTLIPSAIYICTF